MHFSAMRSGWATLGALLFSTAFAAAQAVTTKVVKNADGGFDLQRGGQPYFILGAGGDASKQLLKDNGGNSFRTWGANDIDGKLAEAQRLGLTVTIGIWLEHESANWKYSDPAKVKAQFEMATKVILKYRNNPALLMWGIGNEMEGYKQGDDPLIWNAVEDIAKFAHENDPNHPTMTVIAEIGGKKVPSINQYCPDIDVVGINSYGGGPSLDERYPQAGGVKPFVVTEFGPPGSWESGKNAWGAPSEMTSTDKGAYYRKTYESTILAQKGKLCLGSYAFAWGNKREATATWYGIFLADGTRLEALDQLHSLWTGQPLVQHCPQIQPLKASQETVQPGGEIHVTLSVTHPNNQPMTVKWVLQQDPAQYNTNGETQPEPKSYPEAVAGGNLQGCDLKMPDKGGKFRLYAYVSDPEGNSAVADIPLRTVDAPRPPSPKAKLPLQLYGDQSTDLPYIPSGWMGDTQSISVDDKCSDNPHSGAACMKCRFNSDKGFGGVVWQSPANDWGDKPGGFDLTGAGKLTFWARGETGDETVSFSFGLLGNDKKYYDSASGKLNDQKLTKEWTQYTIDLTGKDLSDIKTGFCWVVASKGRPVTFYLDDIKFE